MVETWYQASCNGCDEVINSSTSVYTKQEFKKECSAYYKWKFLPNDLSYCFECVKKGYHKQKVDIYT